jgi:O-antigen ligase
MQENYIERWSGGYHPAGRATGDGQPLRDVVSALFAMAFLPLAALRYRTVRQFLIAVIVLNLPLQCGTHLFFREDAEEFGSIAGLPISATTFALAALYAGWGLDRSCVLRPEKTIREVSRRPVLLLVFFYALSLLVAADTQVAVFEVWSVGELTLLYLYIARNTQSEKDILFLVRLLLIGLVVQDLIMIAQAVGLLGSGQFLGIRASAEYVGTSRLSGTIGSPNSAASYLSVLMTLAVSIMLAKVRPLDKYLAIAGVALGIVPLICTASRGGWLTLAIACAVVCVMNRKALWCRPALVVLLIVTLSVVPMADTIKERLYGDDHGSAASRLFLNDIAALMIRDHPILGVGANNFFLGMEPYVTRGYLSEFLFTVHNKYLLVWSETGIGGLIAFVWLLVTILRMGLSYWRARIPALSPIALGITAGVIGLMVHMCVEPSRDGPANACIWFFAGLLTSVARVHHAGGIEISARYGRLGPEQ